MKTNIMFIRIIMAGITSMSLTLIPTSTMAIQQVKLIKSADCKIEYAQELGHCKDIYKSSLKRCIGPVLQDYQKCMNTPGKHKMCGKLKRNAIGICHSDIDNDRITCNQNARQKYNNCS